MKVNVSRIDSSLEGFAEIARIHQTIAASPASEVYVDFSRLSWLEANMCAPLAAAFAGEGRAVKLQNVRREIQTILAKNGFLRDLISVDTYGTTMRLQRFDPAGNSAFEEYVEENFRGKGLPAMSVGLQPEFRRSIFELFENAVAHSGTTLGIFACGQFFPNKKQLHFCVTDRGIGIPASVRSYLGRSMDARDAINWAMSGQNTTRRRADRVPGGLGLKIIRDFIGSNGGAIRVASDDGFWQARGDQVERSRLPVRFPGTAVDIEINTADTKMYHLTGEIDPRAIFLTTSMTKHINLAEIVGGPHCVSSADGGTVYDQIANHLRKDEDVIVSFAGVEDVTSAFLNSAVGQLYGDFTESDIRAHLQVVDAEPDHLALLKRVVDRAKEFFNDPEHVNTAVSGVLGE